MNNKIIILSWVLFFVLGVSVGNSLDPVVLTETVINTELLQPISVEGHVDNKTITFVFWPTGSKRKYRLVEINKENLLLEQEEEVSLDQVKMWH